MSCTKKQLDAVKAAFHKHVTDYTKIHSALPPGCRFDSIHLPRCCGAQFISCLGSPKSYAVHWLNKLREKDSKKWPDPYAMQSTQYNELGVYAISKVLQMYAYLFRDRDRPFICCIQADYQKQEGEALRKTGWTRTEDGGIRGNGSSRLHMWTKDAREWEVLTR